MKFLPILAALFLPLLAVAQTESALRQQHEKEWQAAQKTSAALATAADPSEYAAALKNEAVALNLLRRSDEALARLQQAATLTPDDSGIKMQTAVVLDYLGRHDEAGAIYDGLFEQIRDWRAGHIKARKAGDKTKLSPRQQELLEVSLAITANAAINNALRGKPEQALQQFTSIYESRSTLVDADRHTDQAAGWRIWLTAGMRGGDGMRADVATEMLAKTIRVSTPPADALLKLWLGKGVWRDITAAIDGMAVSAAEKEALRTRMHLLAAAYFRHIKRDTETALALLDAENARPFNGCVERLFIRREIAELRK